MSDIAILDTKYIDVKLVEGKLALEVPVKEIALSAIIPVLSKLKEKIPGDLDDKILDKIVEEIKAL